MIVPLHVTVKTMPNQRFVISFAGDAACLVRVGDVVVPSTIIFEGRSSEILQTVHLCKELGVPLGDVEKYLRKTDGVIVEEGDVIAYRTVAVGTVERVVKALTDGRISTARLDTGVVDIRAPFVSASIPAGVHGRVSKIVPERNGERTIELSVTGHTAAPFICRGPDVSAPLFMLKDGMSLYRPSDVPEDCKGKIVVAGRSLSLALYEKLVSMGSSGVIAGGIPFTEWALFDQCAVPVFITEGWGVIPVNSVLMAVLTECAGDFCFLNCSENKMVICPSGVIPSPEESCPVSLVDLSPGQEVQIWDMPYWGVCGTVVSIHEPEELVQVLFKSGEKVVVGVRSITAIGEE